ncbi:MAG: FecCD family ABC transporter permease [Anaerolineales bacterium]
MALSIFIGRYPAPYWMPPRLLFEEGLARQLVVSLRLPRLVAALMLGMSLSAAGLVMQMIFRNPLVEPGFLGVSQGAAFGAALSILWLGDSPLVMELMAATFGVFGLFLSYLISRRIQFGGWVLRLILAGIAVSALFSAGTGVLKYLADPLTELPEITFWLLGGLWRITWGDLAYVLPFVLVGLVVLYLLRWRLNVLSLSDETAFSLGTAPARERTLLLVAAVASTAAVTAIAGVVGWVGLIIPHIARRLFGADGRYTVPASLLLGGAFTVLADDLARTLLPGEIPLGILTSFIGAGVFILLMMTTRVGARP